MHVMKIILLQQMAYWLRMIDRWLRDCTGLYSVHESVLYAAASAVSIGRSAVDVSLLRAAAETLTAADAASLARTAVRTASLHTLPLTQYTPNR